MRRRAAVIGGVVVLAALAGAWFSKFEIAPEPTQDALLNPERLPHTDRVPVGNGEVVRVDAHLVALGREAFYRETFGNERFLTDVLGLLNGGLTPWAMTKALVALGGRGTSNLRVALAEDVRIGDRVLPRGTMIDTGLDVPRGGLFPLGIKMQWDRGHLRAGVTCALCHSTVEPESGKVVEGAPNTDLNVGLMMALASNSAAYYVHTGVVSPKDFADPAQLEAAVDAGLAAWPPGSFDSSPDLVENPTSIPDSFTAQANPYGWSGFAMIGPFKGLDVLTNNVHALNTDATQHADHAPNLYGIDGETYLRTLLRNAASPSLRWDPASGKSAMDVLKAADPTPQGPGLIDVVRQPNYPKADYLTTDGLLASLPGYPVWHHVSAMSAFQNTLQAPPPAMNAGGNASPSVLAAGRRVFEAAGCVACHEGPAFTNHAVLPAAEVGTEPSRAQSLKKAGQNAAEPLMYSVTTPVPLPAQRHSAPIRIDPATAEQLKLAWAQGAAQDGKGGGYKVKGLIGLAWTAPYLHDGGVAVGHDAERQLGVPGTLLAGVPPDPANSLRALFDRHLRDRVQAANAADPRTASVHATGAGHAVWVDAEAGFTRADQDALVAYLLSLTRPVPEGPVAETTLGEPQ